MLSKLFRRGSVLKIFTSIISLLINCDNVSKNSPIYILSVNQQGVAPLVIYPLCVIFTHCTMKQHHQWLCIFYVIHIFVKIICFKLIVYCHILYYFFGPHFGLKWVIVIFSRTQPHSLWKNYNISSLRNIYKHFFFKFKYLGVC